MREKTVGFQHEFQYISLRTVHNLRPAGRDRSERRFFRFNSSVINTFYNGPRRVSRRYVIKILLHLMVVMTLRTGYV